LPLKRPTLVEVNDRNEYLVDSAQYIFCLERYEAGGAIWSDGFRRVELHECNLLYCDYGVVEASENHGGLYLCLWHLSRSDGIA
jgi:hypothetical protein